MKKRINSRAEILSKPQWCQETALLNTSLSFSKNASGEGDLKALPKATNLPFTGPSPTFQHHTNGNIYVMRGIRCPLGKWSLLMKHLGMFFKIFYKFKFWKSNSRESYKVGVGGEILQFSNLPPPSSHTASQLTSLHHQSNHCQQLRVPGIFWMFFFLTQIGSFYTYYSATCFFISYMLDRFPY